MSNDINWNGYQDDLINRRQVIEKAWGNDIEKAQSHKYFKREGTPGNYKYYYTEAEYKQAKGREQPKKEIIPKIEIDDDSVNAYVNGEEAGHIRLSRAIEEHQYDEDLNKEYILIERADVEDKFQRKGIYTKMIDHLIENLKDGQYLISMGRSNDAALFWSKRLGIDEEDAGVGQEKDQQEYAIAIDSDGDYKLKDVSDFNHLDFI